MQNGATLAGVKPARYIKRSVTVPVEVAAGVKAMAEGEDVSESVIYRRVLREGWKKVGEAARKQAEK